MRVLGVDTISADKSVYVYRGLDHVDDFVQHANRGLRREKPGVNVDDYAPDRA